MDMHTAKIEDLIKFKFIGSLEYSPNSRYLSHIVYSSNMEENDYYSDIYLLTDKKDAEKLTTSGNISVYCWKNDKEILFSKKEKDADKLFPPQTKFYSISLDGKEEKEEFTIEKAVKEIIPIGAEKFIIKAAHNINEDTFRKMSEEERKEQKDYEVVDEIPFWLNSAGYTNKKRNHLYVYDSKLNKLKDFTDEFSNVEFFHVKEDKKKVLFITNTFSDKMELYTELYEFDTESEKVTNLSPIENFFYRRAVYVKDTVVFDASYHGMKVLSTIVGELEDTIVGTAPKASILLYRTEDSESENMIEEIYWIKAAEAADSIGADIISTSLGYKDYDIKKNSYKVSDLNGIKSPMSRAVNMCAHKGMLPVMSAGNTGWGLWQRVTIPADADTLLSVAAVTRSGFCGSFSAKGPTPDGRLRPNVAARGVSAIVQSPEGGITYANGTSFACPVLAGMTACLLQAHNKLSPNQIIRSIEKNSSQYYNPEGSKGYGIPDFVKALIFSAPDNSVAEYTATCPNCITKKKSILLNSPKEREKTYELPFNISLKCTDLAGQTIINFHGKPKYSSSKGLSIDNWNMLNAGCYKFELEIIGNHFFGIYINSK